ncbi:hypothetical protein FCG20_08395 [Haemophilus influenzae]|nr:hypothetical protein DV389_07195 [Haemophilus influenzae]NKB31349.1 hypothetical protein [Haemophilus influenzae]
MLISSQAFAANNNSISSNYGIKEFGAYSLIIDHLKNNTINSKKAEEFTLSRIQLKNSKISYQMGLAGFGKLNCQKTYRTFCIYTSPR